MIRRNWQYPCRRRGFWINPYWMKFMALGLLATSCLWIIASHTKFHINRTDSVPYHAFVCTDFLRVGYGDYASIDGHPTDYYAGKHFTKRVVGLPGDSVEVRDNRLYVKDQLIEPLLSITTKGLKLTPLDIPEVPAGAVFVVGDHPRSFDSRYREFGLVKKAHIKGRCFGFGKRKVENL